jgi:hypothetical protein
MSALSKNEREGLEEVFLSIHCHQKKYDIFKKMAKYLKKLFSFHS